MDDNGSRRRPACRKHDSTERGQSTQQTAHEKTPAAGQIIAQTTGTCKAGMAGNINWFVARPLESETAPADRAVPGPARLRQVASGTPSHAACGRTYSAHNCR